MNSFTTPVRDPAVTLDLREMLRNGFSHEQVVAKMRQAGLNKLESIKLLRSSAGFSLAEAKRVVHLSSAWSDQLEADNEFHERVQRAFESVS